MTDDLRLLDDPVDEPVHAFLQGIDRGPRLGVDVDAVIADGTRRRRLVVAERVLAVAATVVVLAGAVVFAVGRAGSDGAPAGPASPPPALPRVSDAWWYSMGDAATHQGLGIAALKNRGTEPVTVSAPQVSGAAGVRAVLTPVNPSDPTATTIDIGYLRKLDQPAPSTVVLPPGESLFVVIGVPVTCTASDGTALAGATVTVALRSQSGGTGSYVLGSERAFPDSWQSAVVDATCRPPTP
ncbi:MAG: hypothetical protein U0R68_15080 [Candidatus Nanopelagicales bacterium]